MNEAQKEAQRRRQREMVASSQTDATPNDRPPPIVVPAVPFEEVVAERRPDVPRGVVVGWMRFNDRTMQLEGMQSGDQLKGNVPQPNGREHRIEYIPEMRHHMVTFLDPPRRFVSFEFVHESQVKSWCPA